MEKNTDTDKKNKNDCTKNKDAAIERIEKAAIKKQDAVLSATEIGATSLPISKTSSVAEQQSYARKKIQAKRKKRLSRQQKLRAAQLKELTHNEKDQEISKATYDEVLALLSQSRLAMQLLNQPNKGKIEIFEDTQIYSVSYFKQANLIAYNPEITLGESLFGIIREARRGWLQPTDDLLYPLLYGPDDAILLNRILEADALTIAIWVAWELKLQGLSQTWAYVMASNYAAMARSFEYIAKKDFRNLENGLAAKAAFDAWFHCGTVKQLDNLLIQTMLSDEKGYFFDLENPTIALTPDLVEAIANVPLDTNKKSNYLTKSKRKPLPQTDYAAVTDRSNANFLWFVKFERSFHETEKSLCDHERNEKERLEQMEEARFSEIDIAQRSKKDEKIIDFQAHFMQQYEQGVEKAPNQEQDCDQSAQSSEAPAMKNKNKDNVLYLFARHTNDYSERYEQ